MKEDKIAKSAHSHGMSMTCRELFERLSEYVDGELSQAICEEIRHHMEGCDPCVAFARTLKTTAELCRRLPSQPIPPEVAADLRAALAGHLSKRK
ncbi:MAG: zf-HC2 domain-containing protein [candidate division NC10 bacterium]|nr:zf-HC2 domain-containing protein [candidate division NC10 bacterium]